MGKETSSNYLKVNTYGVDMGSEPCFAKDKANLVEHLLGKDDIP